MRAGRHASQPNQAAIGYGFDPREGRTEPAFADGNTFERAGSGLDNTYTPLLAALAAEDLGSGPGEAETRPVDLSDEALGRRTGCRIARMCGRDRSVILLNQAVFGFEFANRTTYVRPDTVALIPTGKAVRG